MNEVMNKGFNFEGWDDVKWEQISNGYDEGVIATYKVKDARIECRVVKIEFDKRSGWDATIDITDHINTTVVLRKNDYLEPKSFEEMRGMLDEWMDNRGWWSKYLANACYI